MKLIILVLSLAFTACSSPVPIEVGQCFGLDSDPFEGSIGVFTTKIRAVKNDKTEIVTMQFWSEFPELGWHGYRQRQLPLERFYVPVECPL
jgi:hypothetical protein